MSSGTNIISSWVLSILECFAPWHFKNSWLIIFLWNSIVWDSILCDKCLVVIRVLWNTIKELTAKLPVLYRNYYSSDRLFQTCCYFVLSKGIYCFSGVILHYSNTRSLGAGWALTSSWRPFGPALGTSGLLDIVLCALLPSNPRITQHCIR